MFPWFGNKLIMINEVKFDTARVSKIDCIIRASVEDVISAKNDDEIHINY